MSARTIKGLATLLRNGGNPYQEFRMFLLKPEEAKEYADLLDPPPRFNEAQMALMKGLYQNGAATIRDNPCDSADVIGRNGNKMAEIDHSVFRLKRSETLDLAELLGKDGAET